jgi:hypothetical protein
VLGIGTSDEGLEAAAHAKQLQTVDLRTARVTDRSLEIVSGLKRLRRLELSGEGAISDQGLANLQQLTRLVKLSLTLPAGDVTDKGLPHLAGLEALEELHLYNSKVTGTGLAALGRLKKLKTLLLSNSAFNDEGCRHLVQFPKLEELDPGSTVITDEGLVEIGKLANLRTLTIDNARVTDAGLEHLRSLKQLRMVHARGTKATKEGFARLRAAIPGLNVMDGFSYNGRMSSLSLEADAPDDDEPEKPAPHAQYKESRTSGPATVEKKSADAKVQITHPLTVVGKALDSEGKPIQGATIFLVCNSP